ncbi:MAG: transglycosylase SLT domain-containing protein [Lautropia sp.]
MSRATFAAAAALLAAALGIAAPTGAHAAADEGARPATPQARASGSALAPARAALAIAEAPATVEAFEDARKAMLKADLERYDAAAAKIPRSHPLYRYVEYWRLRILLSDKRPESLSGEADGAVRAFLARHPESIDGDLLRRDWMLALGRREDWRTFDAQYAQWILKDEPSPDCYAQMSRLAARKPDLPAALALVMRPVGLTKACSSLFRALADTGTIDRRTIRQRLMLALEANAADDILEAAALSGLATQVQKVQLALRKPDVALKAGPGGDLRLIALVRLARADPEAAARQMDRVGPAMSTADRRFAWSQIAAHAMRRMQPDAHRWAANAKGAVASEATVDNLMRAALRERDWPMVRHWIEALPAKDRAEPGSRYWLARALAATGQTARASAIFGELRTRRDFYGKLAREELGEAWRVPASIAPPPASEVDAFDGNEGFARAIAFYRLGMRFEGNREWNFVLRDLDPARLHAAAWWARRQGLLDRAINADERRDGEPDVALRFPAPFANELRPIAAGMDLDPAWVYGLIRQESRFVMDARSHVGASGLMQLMPATARWVAKKMGRADFRAHQIDDLKTNLEFGTFYLKNVLDDVDGSQALASAGYNAGPRRAHAWRASLPHAVEGAIFAEIIPFTETRGYVKHVLSNAVDYAAIFTGKPQSIKAWLGTVEPRSDRSTRLP